MLQRRPNSAAARTTLARSSAWSAAAGDPQHIASMPAVAGQLALKQAGLALDDVDVIEINEAFAAVPLVSTLVLAAGDSEGGRAAAGANQRQRRRGGRSVTRRGRRRRGS